MIDGPLHENARLNRKTHQKALQKRRRRLRKRRQNRIRQIRVMRAARTARFWSRVGLVAATMLSLAFWAKFAIVYDIPTYAQHGALGGGVQAYVTVKPWWFGPPAFDLANYNADDSIAEIGDPYAYMLLRIGRYDAVVLDPQIVWIKYMP